MDVVSVINRIFSKDQEIEINLKITNTKRFWFSKVRIVKDCGFKPYQCTSYFKDLSLNFMLVTLFFVFSFIYLFI
jgi:hypothetical protein